MASEVSSRTTVFEIEVRGNSIETCTLRPGKRLRRASVRYPTSEQAERAVRVAIARKIAAKYVEVGPSRMLAPSPPSGAGPAARGSTLLIDELFRAGDARFLDEVLACASDKKLTSLAEPWITDTRPEMRRALLDYVDDGCDRFFHKGLVKHLFKAAERRGDDELMAHFMVAFDRLSRRYPYTRKRWNYQTRTATTQTVLSADPFVPERFERGDEKEKEKKSARTYETARFSRATRRYLSRRAFRYFRGIGRSDKARYGRAMRTALALYQDAHLDSPVRVLDAWSLLHVLYAWSPVLDRSPRGVRVAPGRSLGEVSPAPYFPDAWKGELPALLDLLVSARSRTVRVWTIAWLRSTYADELARVDARALRPLLSNVDEDVARFGSTLFASAPGLETLSVDDWLALLRTENLDVAPVVVAAFEKHVSPRRLTREQSYASCRSRSQIEQDDARAGGERVDLRVGRHELRPRMDRRGHDHAVERIAVHRVEGGGVRRHLGLEVHGDDARSAQRVADPRRHGRAHADRLSAATLAALALGADQRGLVERDRGEQEPAFRGGAVEEPLVGRHARITGGEPDPCVGIEQQRSHGRSPGRQGSFALTTSPLSSVRSRMQPTIDGGGTSSNLERT